MDANAVTRELKLALIVGFALVLGVIILISDHHSAARKADLAQEIQQRPDMTPAPVADAPSSRLGMAESPAPSSSIAADPLMPPPVGNAGPAGTAEQLPAPVSTLTQGTGGGLQPTTGSLTAPSPVGTAPLSGFGDLARAVRENHGEITKDGVIIMPPAAKVDGVAGTSGVQVPAPLELKPPVSSVPEVGNKPKPVDGAKAVTDSTDVKYHVVQANDSLYKITEKYYGNGRYWKKLAEANTDRIGKDYSLRLGVRLKLPAAEVITGKAGELKSTPAPVAAVSNLTPKAATTGEKSVAKHEATAPRTYTVKAGDTLAAIARRELGNAKRANEIFELNKGTIKSPDRLIVGKVLKLPS